MTYSDVDKSFGEYTDDKNHGQGTYTFLYGRKVVGEWEDNTLIN